MLLHGIQSLAQITKAAYQHAALLAPIRRHAIYLQTGHLEYEVGMSSYPRRPESCDFCLNVGMCPVINTLYFRTDCHSIMNANRSCTSVVLLSSIGWCSALLAENKQRFDRCFQRLTPGDSVGSDQSLLFVKARS